MAAQMPIARFSFGPGSKEAVMIASELAAMNAPARPCTPRAPTRTARLGAAPPASEAIFFTLQAFDAGGGYLNSQQFTAYAQVSYLIGRGSHVYPIALIGSTYWMLANYQFASEGSYDYGNNPGNEASFGRLYDSRVLAQAPDGWSVPTIADWNALFSAFGDAKQAYGALSAGGRSGFNAQPGGRRAIQPDGSGIYEQMYVYGYYWAADGNVCAQFSSPSGQVSAGTPVPDSRTALSVRFIRHA